MFAVVTALSLGEAGRVPQCGYSRLLGRNKSQVLAVFFDEVPHTQQFPNQNLHT
jgi:hypothetical protein